jgi:putative tricarboxylic transport membrane protein
MQPVKSLAINPLMALCVGVVGLSAGPAAAQDFPAEPITIIVNWPAGGAHDTIARLIAGWASKRVNVPIVVLNVTGAAGANGARRTAEAKPDGYTVGIIGAAFVVRSYINKNATPLDGIDPIVFIGTDPGALEVRADTGIKTVRDYVDKLRAEPGSITNGNDPPGGAGYMMAARLESFFDIEMTMVPYQGYAPTVAALVSGEVESATLPVNQIVEQYKAGAVRILAVAAEERSFQAPDVPTFKELGFDFVAGDWGALFLPNGVPSDRKAYLETLFMNTMTDPAFLKAARMAGYIMTPLPAEETKARIRAYDEMVYPILLEAKLVKARAK